MCIIFSRQFVAIKLIVVYKQTTCVLFLHYIFAPFAIVYILVLFFVVIIVLRNVCIYWLARTLWDRTFANSEYFLLIDMPLSKTLVCNNKAIKNTYMKIWRLCTHLPAGTAIRVAFIFEIRHILHHPLIDLAQR